MLALAVVLGAIFGSFANVCIHRIPKNESIAYPPSHCPKCKNPLKPIDLIPILSFILLWGKCRHCKENISVRYILVEIVMAASFGVLWVISHDPTVFLWYAVHFFVLCVLSMIDIEHMILPNSLIIAGIVIALLFSPFIPGLGVYQALLGGLTGFFILLVISMLSGGKMGGGDVKLMAYIGLLVGPVNIFFVLFIGAFLGIIVHIPASIVLNKKLYGQIIPFGPYLSLAGLINMLYGDEIVSLWLSMVLIR